MVISVAIHILQRLLHLDSNIFFESLFLWLIGFKYIGTFPDSFLRGAIQIGVVEHAVLSYWFFGRRISLLFACVGFCLWGIYLFIFLVRVISFFKYINCLISSNIWIFFNFFCISWSKPLTHLKQQFDCITIASIIFLIGCYSLLSTLRNWIEVS